MAAEAPRAGPKAAIRQPPAQCKDSCSPDTGTAPTQVPSVLSITSTLSAPLTPAERAAAALLALKARRLPRAVVGALVRREEPVMMGSGTALPTDELPGVLLFLLCCPKYGMAGWRRFSVPLTRGSPQVYSI